MSTRLIAPEGHAVENPSEPELAAALDSLESDSDTLTVYRSSISWLCVRRGHTNRFYFHNYSLWNVGQAVQPVSRRSAERMLSSYAAGEWMWNGGIRFTNPRDKEAVVPDAEEGSSEMWRQVATTVSEQELAHAPRKLRMVALCVVLLALLFWGSSGLSFASASLIAVAAVAATVSYAAWTFKKTGEALERFTRGSAS